MPTDIELATRGDMQDFRGETLLRPALIDGRITEVEGSLTRHITGLDQRITELDKHLDVDADEPVDARSRISRGPAPRAGRAASGRDG